jgi:hypothetical protein
MRQVRSDSDRSNFPNPWIYKADFWTEKAYNYDRSASTPSDTAGSENSLILSRLDPAPDGILNSHI